MIACLILLGSLIVVGLILRISHRPDRIDEEAETPSERSVNDEECCGLHEICEKINVSRLSTPEYYDDEELDELAGTPENGYSSAQVDTFREIMLTLLPADIAGWKASLDNRGIALPSELKDEFLLLLTEKTGN